MSNKIASFKSLRKTTTVDISEMGGPVILQQLTLSDLENIQGKTSNSSAWLLAYSIVDEDHKRMYFSDEDIANLCDMPASISRPLIAAFNKLNGFGQTEEIEKNS